MAAVCARATRAHGAQRTSARATPCPTLRIFTGDGLEEGDGGARVSRGAGRQSSLLPETGHMGLSTNRHRQPNVNENTWIPGSRKSIWKVRSAMSADWRSN